MKRHSYADLIAWKSSPRRKPLLLLGARQVGKTYLVREFGANEFRRIHLFNFEAEADLVKSFERDLDPVRILKELSFRVGASIDPQTDLVFFDEIQSCPAALTSLKHFHERLPVLAVCAAGSLLGTHLTPASFPVGNVDILRMYPLSFAEFVEARAEPHVIKVHRAALGGEAPPSAAHQTLWDFWREYLVTGGLPEVVAKYIANHPGTPESFAEARMMQGRLITAYLADIAKHSGKVNAMHIERVWRAVPTQLAAVQDQSTQRFGFKDVVPGIHSYGRLVSAIDWLSKAGLVLRLPICHHAETPIAAFTKENQFRLYMFDVGLLGAMLSLPPVALMGYGFGTYKGFLAENFVAQELVASRQNASLFGWTEGSAEIEFLLQGSSGAVPVEVKSGQRVRAQSLRSYISKYKPATSIIISGRESALVKDSATGCLQVSVPLYLVPTTWNFINCST